MEVIHVDTECVFYRLIRKELGDSPEDTDLWAWYYHEIFMPLSPGRRAYLLALAGQPEPGGMGKTTRIFDTLPWELRPLWRDGGDLCLGFRRFLLSLIALPSLPPLDGGVSQEDIALYDDALCLLIRRGEKDAYAALAHLCGDSALRAGYFDDARRYLLCAFFASGDRSPIAVSALERLLCVLLPFGMADKAEMLCRSALAEWKGWDETAARIMALRACAYLYSGDILRCEGILRGIPAEYGDIPDAVCITALVSCLRGVDRMVDTAGCSPFVIELAESAAGLLPLPIRLQAGEDIPYGEGIIAAGREIRALAAEAAALPCNPALWDRLIVKAEAINSFAHAQMLLRAALSAFTAALPEASDYAAQCMRVSEKADYQYLAAAASDLRSALGTLSQDEERRYLEYKRAQSPRLPGAVGASGLSIGEAAAPANGRNAVLMQSIPFSLPSAAEGMQEGLAQVCCFDGFAVSGPASQTPLRFRTRKAQELLAYLVHNADHMIDREQIMAELWPDKSSRQARTLLHTTLYNLRKALEPVGLIDWVEHDKHAYGVHAARVYCDYIRLDRCLIEIAPLPDEALREHAFLLSLYAGPYMRGMDGGWYQARQARFEQQVSAAHKRIAQHLQRIGEYKESLAHYQQIVLIDPLNEPMQMQLIACHVQLGNRTAAIQQYRLLCNLLREELDAEPDAVTLQYAKRLLGGDPLAGYAS